MGKIIINTGKAPAPIGPYNQAIKVGGTLYISGQIPLSPESGELVNGSVIAETTQALINLGSILGEAGYSFEDVVKTTIFLTDMAFFADVNEVYASFFTTSEPARETVAVKGLPKGVRVEISAVAFKD